MEYNLETKEIDDRIINFINSEFGDDISSLSKARELFDRVSLNKRDLENRLSLATTQAPSKIASALFNADESCRKIQQLNATQTELSAEISNHMIKMEPLVKDLSEFLEKIRHLERYLMYLSWIAKIDEYSSEIQSALLIAAEQRAVESFSKTAEMCKSMQGSNCSHLVKYVNETVMFWYKMLKDRLASNFDEILKIYRWPFVSAMVHSEAEAIQPETSQKLESLFLLLVQLQVPDNLITLEDAMILPGWRPIILPIRLLLLPLRKRFLFHFQGNKQTNSLEKPEWVFTQTLSWIRDHSNFLLRTIQPLLVKANLGYLSAKTEFTRGLLALVVDKLSTDIQLILHDEALLTHTIDETLQFDKELQNDGYPSSQPSCLQVLTQEDCFERWLSIEKRYASEKVDTILSSPTAWLPHYKEVIDLDDLRVPECGEYFMTLLHIITDRYRPLPESSHKLKFLDLQLDFLDDFRLRLHQLKNTFAKDPLGLKSCGILNTANYVVLVLKEWSDLPFFLQMQYFHLQQQHHLNNMTKNVSSSASSNSITTDHMRASYALNSSGSKKNYSESHTADNKLDQLDSTVFDEAIQLFNHLKLDMLKAIVESVMLDVKAKSKGYRNEKWFSLPSAKEHGGHGLSSSACEMFMILRSHLHMLSEVLCLPLFNTIWQQLAYELNNFIYDEVILLNRFSEGGAAQLHFDMMRNLFPLFGQYTQKPENHFKDVKEACILLNLSTGSAILLLNILKNYLYEDQGLVESKPSARAALDDVSVFKLSPKDAERILSLRTCLSIM